MPRKRKKTVYEKRPRRSIFQDQPLELRKRYGDVLKAVPNGRGYTAYRRVDALFAYFAAGTLRGAAELIDIPYNTIISWSRNEWWAEAMNILKELKQDELDMRYTKIIDKAAAEVEDRLEHGDEVMISVTEYGDNGKPVRTKREAVRQKVKGKDAMLINAMAYDKRALLRGQATSRVENVNIDQLNAKLIEQFRSIASGKTFNSSGEIVEGEDEHG